MLSQGKGYILNMASLLGEKPVIGMGRSICLFTDPDQRADSYE